MRTKIIDGRSSPVWEEKGVTESSSLYSNIFGKYNLESWPNFICNLCSDLHFERVQCIQSTFTTKFAIKCHGGLRVLTCYSQLIAWFTLCSSSLYRIESEEEWSSSVSYRYTMLKVCCKWQLNGLVGSDRIDTDQI